MVIKQKIIAMVPARMGSTRLPRKNLALIGGHPLISYAIIAAKKSGVFDRVVVNSEDILFANIAKRYGADFYQRPPQWATSTAKSDSVVYDFIKNNPSDIVAWVNPISPLQTGDEINQVVNHFLEQNLDTLITVKDEHVHCVYNGEPVNFDPEELFAQTQDIVPVQPFVYSIMMWRTEIFSRVFEEKGYAFFCGKVGYYPVSKLSAIIIKRKEDLMLAEYVLRAKMMEETYTVKYDNITDISMDVK